MMRPTGEISGPEYANTFADFLPFVSRPFVIRLLVPPPRGAFAPGFVAIQPSRVDSVNGS